VKRTRKLGILGIALGIVVITSLLTLSSSKPAASVIKDLEREREQNLDAIDKASVYWQGGLIGSAEFLEIIDEAVADTEALRDRYLALSISPRYEEYRDLSIISLDNQREAFLKLREYVGTEEEQRSAVREEFDRLILISFEYRRDALKELNLIELERIGTVNALP
jgi:hypothetical protein